MHCYTAFRVPGSKQSNADRSSVFNTFYGVNSGKENENRTRLTYPITKIFVSSKKKKQNTCN